jgi:hypothetical protein
LPFGAPTSRVAAAIVYVSMGSVPSALADQRL